MVEIGQKNRVKVHNAYQSKFHTFSPQFVKPRLENAQAIASFSWRNAWYHWASMMEKGKRIALGIVTFV